MNCSDVERWLDRGMPDSGSERAMRHVAACGACFEAFEAASGLESALRAEGASARAATVAAAVPAAPEFVANVMARVATADSLALGARLERRRARFWITLATDPIIVCSITAALVVAVWTVLRPGWFLDAGMNLAARWWLSTSALALPSRIELKPVLWIGIAIAVLPLVLWGSWALYRRFERAVLLLAARPGRL
ncbi:MAG: hypothetical protein E6K79_10750 [Candidatus Eisenbacteria bacterium]|uniref:Zinc-finger domain-containing protein n=1 Tax=Eiseniibacteriota bacterium TaxID=2212470 RepID=A0A538THL8_UNCEI|nr:MAG: hypothetical protein E6K79_10750 [Candidatus Eisenbacteria bacterium]